MSMAIVCIAQFSIQRAQMVQQQAARMGRGVLVNMREGPVRITAAFAND